MDVATGILSILLGGGILTFIQFLISRHDAKYGKNQEILNEIKTLSGRVKKIEESLEERDAVMARTNILRFQDEMYNGMKHAQESFEQIMDSIEEYERYCSTHPTFTNGRTKTASRFISSEYERLFREHKL